MKYAAVIAAAGLSSRMHEFKPMLCLGENTMIETVIQNFRNAGVEDIVVVAGYKADILTKHLEPLGVTVCNNTRYTETKMFDSLKMGLRVLNEEYDAVFLTPGDVPLVHLDTIRRMMAENAAIARPVHDGRLGHPVKIAGRLVPNLLAYPGERGLLGAVESMGEPILDLQVDDVGAVMDADTPEDFKALRRRDMELRSGGRLWPDIRVHIAKGDTILTPETAQFLEMVDHTGSIQNACACVHISYTKGWRMLNRMEKELGYPLLERQPGGASGGGSILTDKGRQLLAAYQEYHRRLRQISQQLFEELFPEQLHQ